MLHSAVSVNDKGRRGVSGVREMVFHRGGHDGVLGACGYKCKLALFSEENS